MPLSWPPAGLSSFIVHKLTENTVKHSIFKSLEQSARVGTSDTRDQKVLGSNPVTAKVVFSSAVAVTFILFASSE